MIKLKFFIIFFLIISLIYIAKMIKEEKLLVKHALLWSFLSFAILFMMLIPKTIDKLAIFLGIVEPVNAVFFIGFIFVLILEFSFMIQISRLSDREKNLVQMIAIINYEYEKRNKK